MLKAIKEYWKLQVSGKKLNVKLIQVILVYVVYAAIVIFAPELLSLTFGWTLIFIMIVALVFVSTCVPFTNWYLTKYKEEK